MKKIFIISSLFLLLLSSAALATTTDNATAGAGSALELADLTIGVSPGVFAYYEDDNNGGNVQWWAIATAHQGGTRIYGAAQNNSGTFYIDVGTNTITGPLTADETYTLPNQDQAASDSYWSTSDWDR
ncbi:hypothetical protein [uncultured Desulfuromusa sp.]|uniref:hypothetical protein n=1 Tax=uncultured Desulfuromusa sp. TaxID=219183 RepID=UPI002AA5FA66|nr:hypothetical protein [uncultured Desulfuromusa sp.]